MDLSPFSIANSTKPDNNRETKSIDQAYEEFYLIKAINQIINILNIINLLLLEIHNLLL